MYRELYVNRYLNTSEYPEIIKQRISLILLPEKNYLCFGVVVTATAKLHSTMLELCRFKSCSRHVGNLWWWRYLTLIRAGNKAKLLSSVNHTAKTIYCFVSNLGLGAALEQYIENIWCPVALVSLKQWRKERSFQLLSIRERNTFHYYCI